MGGWIKQSTAHTFQLGPFVDSADGYTPEASLTIAATDVDLSKAGGAFADKNDATALTGTGDSSGYYDCVLNTTDTGTLGSLKVRCYVSGALPVWEEFLVVPANVYDSIVAGTDTLQADSIQWLGTALHTPGTAGVPLVDIHDLATAVIDLIWDEVLTSGHAVSGSGGKLMADYLNASISAVKTKTDSLTFTVAGKIDANVYTWNGTAVHTPDTAGIPIVNIHNEATFHVTAADALLDRNLGTGTDSGGRTVRNALRPSVNQVVIAASVMTVYKEDDTTSAWTAAVAGTAGASPITSINPA